MFSPDGTTQRAWSEGRPGSVGSRTGAGLQRVRVDGRFLTSIEFSAAGR